MVLSLRHFKAAAFVFLSAMVVLAADAIVFNTKAAADSCWNHNGSVMRLKASGNQRWFYYEKPRTVLRAAGVRRGTLLFSGRKNGNWYSGMARRFSKYCPGSPLEYYVEGPVASNQLKVTVRGTRDVFRRCQNTGNVASDTLVFTFIRRC